MKSANKLIPIWFLVIALVGLTACAAQEPTPSGLDLETTKAIMPALEGVESTTVETAESMTTPTMPPLPIQTPIATAETIVTPSTTSVADALEEWLIYENDFFGYRFSYPSSARISKQGVTGFPAEELPENVTTEEYWEQLETTYPADLCVSVQYGSGFVAFVPSDEIGGKYTVPCGVTGVGDYDMVDVVETVLIDGKPYTASGFRLYERETGGWRGEYYILPFNDRIAIHFGSRDRVGSVHNTTQEEFLDVKETLLQILSSFRFE
jgi:hypothetical protein